MGPVPLVSSATRQQTVSKPVRYPPQQIYQYYDSKPGFNIQVGIQSQIVYNGYGDDTWHHKIYTDANQYGARH